MDEIIYKKLEEIARKPIELLTKDEIDFIKARRTYLTAQQVAFYADLIGEKTPVAEIILDEWLTSASPSLQPLEDEPEVIKQSSPPSPSIQEGYIPSEMSELRARAKELGFNTFGRKKAELIEMITR